MLFPEYSLTAFVAATICGLIVATLYLIRRGVALNATTSGGLFWIRFIDFCRWFFQILFTWFALSALAPLQALLFFVSVILFLQIYVTLYSNSRETQVLGLLLVQVHNAHGSVPDLLEAYASANPTLLGAKARLAGEALRRGEQVLSVTQRLNFRLPTATRLALESPTGDRSATSMESSLSGLEPTVVSKLALIVVYIPFLLLFMGVILSFLAISIVPTFIEMFEEFELRSPGVQLLVWTASVLFPIIVSGVILLGLYICVMWFFWMIGFADALRFIPIIGPLILHSRRAMILDSLAFATECQRSLPDAIQSINNATSYAAERRTMASCLIDLQQGYPIKKVLRRIVSSPQAHWLEAASQTNHLPETFRNLAMLIRMRTSRSMEWGVSLFLPIAIILSAIPVLLVCYAVMSVLTELILGLT